MPYRLPFSCFLKQGAFSFRLKLAVVCLSCLCVQAQEAEFHKILFQPNGQITGTYTEVKEANLPIKGAQVLYQSSDQTIWIGTEADGLIAYTGASIKHYRLDPKNKNSLPSNRIQKIWEESPSVLWITTHDGIVKFNRLSGSFTRFAAKSRFVRKAADGALYTTVMGQGLFRIDTARNKLHPAQRSGIISDKGIRYPEETITLVWDLQTDKEGTLWAMGTTKTLQGLFHFDAKTGYWVWHAPATCYARSPTYPLQIYKKTNPRVMAAVNLFIDDSNQVWFGGWHEGLYCYNKKTGKWQQYQFYRASTLTDNIVLDIYPLVGNVLWISSYYNGFIFNPQQKTAYHYTYMEGENAVPPFEAEPHFTLTDHSGSRWIASQSGVFKHNPVQSHFSVSGGFKKFLFKNSILTSFYEINPEHYLIGFRSSTDNVLDRKLGIAEIKSNVLIQQYIQQGYNSFREFVPLKNDLFFVTAYRLCELDKERRDLKMVHLKITNAPNETRKLVDFYNTIKWNDSILFNCVRSEPNIGLVKINIKTKETKLYKTNSTQLSPHLPQDNTVLRLMKDSYNRIWCSTSGGLDIFYPERDRFEHYSPIENDTTSLLGQHPRFCETSDRTFYIASRSGVCATKAVPGTRAKFTVIAYLDCEWIVADNTDQLWVGTPQGIARIDPVRRIYKLFTEKDGYYWNPVYKPLVMPDGRFVMHDGVIMDPVALKHNPFKPVPRVSSFLVAGQPFPLDTAIEFKQHIRLKNDQNFFSIQYTCNSYVDEAANIYRYRLQHVDKDWVEAGQRTEAYYTALEPGTYHFHLQAANNDGVWGEPKKLLTITIIAAWYQTSWFKIGAALLIGAIVFAFYHLRIQQEKMKGIAKRREAELKQREAELGQLKAEFDKQLAETEMAALRAQMNPHFIFNVLNSINKYILSNDKKTASEYLVQFSRLIRLTLENSKSAKVPLQADLEALRIYIAMEKLRFGDRFTCLVELDNNIDPQYLQIPPLLVQPYLENAIWHGLMQRDSPGSLLVQLTQPEEGMLKVVVQDNGIGRKQAQELKSKSATAHKSYGLQITSDRLKIVNKLYGIEATVTVEDLYDAAQQPAGTKVTLLIPV